MLRVLPFILVLILASPVACGGCGGGQKTNVSTTTTTTGQELIDLQKALDAGAISQGEYDKEKKKILKRK